MDSYIRARTLTYTCYARVYVTWRPRSAANLAPSEKSRIWNSGESKNRARLPGYPFEATRNRNSFEASSPTTLKVTSGEKSICPERERDPLFKNVHRDVSRASIFRFRFVSRFPTRRHTPFIDREVVECSVCTRKFTGTRSGWRKKKEGKKEEEEEEEEKEKREEKKAVRPRADRFIDLSSGLLSPSFFTFLSTLGFSFSLLTLFC